MLGEEAITDWLLIGTRPGPVFRLRHLRALETHAARHLVTAAKFTQHSATDAALV